MSASAGLIPTRVHGILDYSTGAALTALPRALRPAPRVSAVITAGGMGAIAYSLITRYEWGVIRVLPMQVHLAIDALSAGMFLGSAVALRRERRSERLLLAGIGAFEAVVTLLSKTETDV
jgi:hypothetical protein